MSYVNKLTSEDFEAKVTDSTTPIVFDFYANWCGPCRILAPILEQIAAAYAGRIQFYKVDVDQERDLSERFAITSIPTLAMIKNGRVVGRHAGLMDPRQLMVRLDLLLQNDRVSV